MHTDKKLTKEDTWRPADLRRYIREEGPGGDVPRRRDDYDRKHRGGESTERHRRDPEKESRRERDKHRERESTREGRREVENDRYADRHKEGSRDRRGDKDRERRDEREREKRRERDKLVDGKRNDDDHRDRRRDREEKHDRDKDKERHRDKDMEREKDREKRREERDKERRREERNREHRSERKIRRHEEVREGERDLTEKLEREKRERHRERQRHNDEYEEKWVDKERRERHGDRKHSELREEREHREEHRRHKEERERRHKERGHQDEKRMPDSESRERQRLKGSDGEVRHHRSDRERAERDRHRERRHKERTGRELEENQKEKDRSSSPKQTEKNNRHETKTKEVAALKQAEDSEEPVVDAEEQAEQEYEDDFEDCEEDFEDMDESANEDEEEKEPQNPEEEEEQRDELTAQRRKEIEAIKRAMDEENERVGTAQSRSSTSREEEEEPKWTRSIGSEKSQSRASHRGTFINFVAAKQREVSKKVATKQKKRSKELLRLIDLDFSLSASLLDLPPVNEYDMYIRSFGNANTKQAYCQCNEDNADRGIQTEEIEVCEKWTQHPSEHSGDCGDPTLSQSARDKTTSELSFDSQRLTAFLHSALQVMVVLLEEAEAEKKSLRKLKSQTDVLSFSDGSLQLNTKLPFLHGRHIRLVHFSQVQRHTLMTVHDPTSKPSAVRLDSCTIICIWNIREPSRPQKILFYESEVLCCCFSPRKASLVFAGTSVGSVVLWDLREQAKSHQCMKIGENDWTLRQPTFSTDAVMAGSGHFSSVTSVEVVPSAAGWGLGPEVPLLASEEESSGLSFQLASLDDSGVLNFWVVVELPKSNDAGSPTDLGLRPGGKVKLLHSSSLLAAERVSPRDAVKTGPVQTLHLKFLPTDSNHFFIGTNMGLVNHGTSHGLKTPPKFYRFQEAGVRPVKVTSINFCPFCSHLFLVGCGDGSIRLHTVSQEQPVAEWTNSTAGEPVVSLQWTQTRPAVFCALDSASNLHIWDLMKNETEPVVTERIHSDRVTAMAVFGDSGQQNTYSGIALAHESGKIEMQYFSRNFTVPVLAEEEKLKDMMSEAF
ncbi:cytoplasmic dynein 2 intermediate chain 1 isoform X1 [Halichoeres trimaculatus]|uniref:cytoplasmic dynein 2 intermediate chain 1 isoform X1 n=1 Tax=Halichoeres trimaculatus TaxID=147232 RepID=UPI003D9DC724